MTRRTKSHAQHSDAPPPTAEPIHEQGSQQDMNDLHMKELPKHRLRKEPMTIVPDNGIDLGDLTRRTEWVEDVIGVVQTTINQLNQFLIRATGQGIQRFQTMAIPAQQTHGPRLGGNRNLEQADKSLVELTSGRKYQRRKSHSL